MSEYDDIFDSIDDFGDDEDTQKDRFLTFKIAKEYYAIDICYVVEIIGLQKITPIPDKRKYIKGVMNLRGNIIPVVDVRIRFGLVDLEYNDRTCIIVVDYEDSQIGLIVDEVADVLNIPENDIDLPPKTNKGSQGIFIKGVGKIGDSIRLLLNLNTLLSEEIVIGNIKD